MPLGVESVEQEAFDLVGGIQRVSMFFVEGVGIALEHAAHVSGVAVSTLVDDFAEDQYLAGSENVGRGVVEGAPIDAQTQIALALRGEAADGGAVEGQV